MSTIGEDIEDPWQMQYRWNPFTGLQLQSRLTSRIQGGSDSDDRILVRRVNRLLHWQVHKLAVV